MTDTVESLRAELASLQQAHSDLLKEQARDEAEVERLTKEFAEAEYKLDLTLKGFERLLAEHGVLRDALQKIADASVAQYPAGGMEQALQDIACAVLANTASKEGGAA